MHQEPLSKGQRLTDSSGSVTAKVELDPWGGETGFTMNGAQQPHTFTTYERDTTGGIDEAMARRYHGWWSRFDQPDPYDGSYDMANPQSFNRYSYVQNDPVNFIDPSGLMPQMCGLYSFNEDGLPRYGFICFGNYYPFYGYEPKDPIFLDPPDQEPAKPSHTRDDRTDCERMADDAQREADKALLQNPLKTRPDLALGPFNEAFGMITFGSFFTPFPGGFRGTQASGRNNVLGNRDYQGESGFPDQFKDTLIPGDDQVHHFGAMFSAGLGGQKLAKDYHRANDRDHGNHGDVRLTDQSYRLGAYLNNNPGQLANIGQLIRDTICNGKEVPK